MSRTTYIIIGCALYLQHSGDFAWGDLHMQGDRFIFNGVVDRDGCMKWSPEAPEGRERGLCIPMGEEYFERRGVLICRASQSLLNAAAVAYINSAPHGTGVPE